MERRKISRRRPRSVYDAELGHFTFVVLQGRQSARHVHGTCTARAPLLLYSSTTNDRCAKISVEDDETLSIPRIIGFCLCLVPVSSVRTDFDSVTSWAPVYNIYASFYR